jgi:hypothetical protein
MIYSLQLPWHNEAEHATTLDSKLYYSFALFKKLIKHSYLVERWIVDQSFTLVFMKCDCQTSCLCFLRVALNSSCTNDNDRYCMEHSKLT